MLLVGYVGLFRISGLLDVKVKDISISDIGMSVFVPQGIAINFVKATLLLLLGLVRFHAQQWLSLRQLLIYYRTLRILLSFRFCVEL